MLFVVLAIGTILLIIWFALLTMPIKEDWLVAAYNRIVENLGTIDKLRIKDAKNAERLAAYHGIAHSFMKLFLGGTSDKQIEKLENQNQRIRSGDFKYVGLLDMPGYVLLRKNDSIGKSTMHRTILTKSLELYGRKYAENKAKQLLARIVSYPIIGVALTLLIGAGVMVSNPQGGIIILSVGSLLVLVLVYAMYDEISDKANKRREAITRQFPNVVSKLALLVTSGMIMDKAWNDTAFSQDLELYKEMQRTSQELSNLVSPEAAYGSFISRCNTKETTKLASAILQNLSKGNAEVGQLLKTMAKEAWSERRHTAKRDTEKANAKMMIPSMLLFLVILIMIMVPIAVSM